jgi:hypothetical protein
VHNSDAKHQAAAHPVDVLLWIIRGVILDDPFNRRDVQAITLQYIALNYTAKHQAAAYPVDVILWIIRGVILDDPMNRRDVQAITLQYIALHSTAKHQAAAYPMNVFLWIIRGIVLDDPVHGGDVQATRSNVCAQQDALVCLAELEEGGGALGLLLLAVNVLHGYVNVVEQLAAGKVTD